MRKEERKEGWKRRKECTERTGNPRNANPKRFFDEGEKHPNHLCLDLLVFGQSSHDGPAG